MRDQAPPEARHAHSVSLAARSAARLPNGAQPSRSRVEASIEPRKSEIGARRGASRQQSPRGHARLLDHQDSRHDARGNRRRHRDHDDGPWLSDGHGDLSFGAGRAGGRPNRREEVSSPALLVRHRRLDHGRHDAGRLRDPVFGDRIYGWVALAVRLPDGRARPVVLVGGLRFGGDGQRAQGGSLLLGGDHVLADLGNRARRLDRRCRTWIWRSGAGFRRRTGGADRGLLLDERLSGHVVLGRVHSHAPA